MHNVKTVLLSGCKVWVIDHDDAHHLVCLADGENNARQIAMALGLMFHVEVHETQHNVLDLDTVIYRPEDVEAETIKGVKGQHVSYPPDLDGAENVPMFEDGEKRAVVVPLET